MTKPLLHWPLPRRRHRTFADLNFLIVDARPHCSPYHLRMCGMLSRKEKSLCPLGCFVARKDGCKSITEPATFRSRDQSMRKINISPISINCRQKRSIGPPRKKRKMMPRGPRGESNERCCSPRRVHVVGKDDTNSTSKKQE